MNQAAYDGAIRRLRWGVVALSVVLLALVARSIIDGTNLAVALTEALTALLLLASGALWRYLRRLEPHASASRTNTPTARPEERISGADRHESSGAQ